MTTITFKRSGGFVGKGMRFQLKLDELPSNDARALIRLIEQAEFFNLPENLIVKFNPDEYQYTITVDAGVICHANGGYAMLVLSRKKDEAGVIGGSEDIERMIKVTVVEIRNGRVRLGFEADAHVPVNRLEVWERIRGETTLAEPVA